MAGAGARRRTLAEKVDHLFHEIRPARGEYSNEHVANAIRESGGPTISATYIWQLRKGIRDNPTKKHLEALSGFFGVPVSYFFDDDLAERVDAELRLLTALRDESVRKIALGAQDLSPVSRQAIAAMVEQARKVEGLVADPVTWPESPRSMH
jgi:transcriptional regulator with XRE-family HTH domain